MGPNVFLLALILALYPTVPVFILHIVNLIVTAVDYIKYKSPGIPYFQEKFYVISIVALPVLLFLNILEYFIIVCVLTFITVKVISITILGIFLMIFLYVEILRLYYAIKMEIQPYYIIIPEENEEVEREEMYVQTLTIVDKYVSIVTAILCGLITLVSLTILL